MRNFRRFRIARSSLGCVLVCLAFTGGGVAWADEARMPDFYVEDPDGIPVELIEISR